MIFERGTIMAKVIEMKRSEVRTQTIQVGSGPMDQNSDAGFGLLGVLAACLIICSPIIYGTIQMMLGK